MAQTLTITRTGEPLHVLHLKVKLDAGTQPPLMQPERAGGARQLLDLQQALQSFPA